MAYQFKVSEEDILEFKQLALSEWSIDLSKLPDEYVVDQIERFIKLGQLLLQDPLEITKSKEENLEDESYSLPFLFPKVTRC